MSVGVHTLGRRGLAQWVLLLALSCGVVAWAGAQTVAKARTPAANAMATKPRNVVVALIALDDDARYTNRRLERAYPGHPSGRLLHAAQLAVADTELALADEQLTLQLRDVTVASAADLPAALQKLKNDQVAFWVLDVPAGLVPAVTQTAGTSAVVFNASAPEDVLRGAQCGAHLFHTFPSQAMQADAMAQYLASRSWRNVLVLQGAAESDQPIGQAWTRAAKRYGLKTTVKPFKLSGDPRERDLSNVRLLTADRNHDVVAVLDADGEFARTVPYATQHPRPVVGSNGLVALAWHPQWERNGGPQVSRRFRKLANRPMVGQDWAAWMAVRSVAAAALAQPTGSPIAHARALRSGQVAVDGSKGPRLSYRSWDGQLRQPLFLSHVDGVIATAPLDGVLHPTEVLDTLGVDETESVCRQRP
jgi:ABC transporter substrate binding protein (PQQ-dependent alcohol dehydrogenase system)